MMRKRFRTIFIFAAIGFYCSSYSIIFSQEHIRFIYFNDFHAQNTPLKQDEAASFSPLVGGAATLAAYIDSFKQGYEERSFVIDAGDDFQGSPICEITKGRSQVMLLNAIKPDIMTLGNHEFDYGREGINYLLKHAAFPIVVSNLLDKKEESIPIHKYLVKKVGNIRIGFIGLITTSMPKLTFQENIEGYVFLNKNLAVKSTISKIKDKVDLIVVVSHCGDRADISLARKNPEINIIFGGHTHKRFYKPLIKNNVIICQAGAKGKYIGVLDIWVNQKNKKISNYQSRLIDTFVDNIKPNPVVKHLVDSLESTIKQEFDEVLAILKTPWIREMKKESNIGNWITDAMREYTGADVAFQNKNGIRKDLSSGNVTRRDIWEIMPFSNRFVSFQVTGDELLTILENNVKGKSDFLLASGVRYAWYLRGDTGNRIGKVTVGGVPVEHDTVYTICTNDYLVGKNKFSDAFGLPAKEHKLDFSDKLIREILVEKAKSEKVISSRKDGRIKRIKK